MYEVIQSDSVTPQLMEFLEDAQVDSNDLVDGTYTPARIDVPDADDIVDTDPKPAATEEDTSTQAVEVKSGTATSGEESGWYKVTFAEAFGGEITRPIVNATATRRVGEFDSAEFQPPSMNIEGVDLIGVEGIEVGSVGAGRVDAQTIGLDEVTIGQIEIGQISLGEITVPAPEIRDIQLSHEADISGADVALEAPTLDGDISVSDFGVNIGSNISGIGTVQDFQFPSPNVSQVKNQFEDIGSFSFESTLRQTNRDSGRELYDAGEQAFQNIPVNEIQNAIINAWDTIMKETYGYGDSRASDSGWVEDFWGAVGAELDDVLETELGKRFFDNGRVADRVDQAFDNMQQDVTGLVEDFAADLDTQVGDSLDEVASDLETTQEDIDSEFSSVNSEVNATMDELQTFIEDELVGLVTDMEEQINTFINQDLQDSLLTIDDALIDTEQEVNALSTEVNEQFDILTEDIEVGFGDLSTVVQEEFNSSMGQTQTQVNNALADLEVSINDNFISMEEQVNNSIVDIQETSNIAIEDLEVEINNALEDLQIDTNDTVIDIEEQVNSRLDDVDANFVDLNSRLNNALAEITAQAEVALNESIELLYSTMGMPQGELMVPVQIRNVTSEGFEFLGYQGGTKIDWVAMGRTGSQIDIGRVGGGGTGDDSGSDGGSDDGDGGGAPGGDIDSIVEEVISRIEDRTQGNGLQGVSTTR